MFILYISIFCIFAFVENLIPPYTVADVNRNLISIASVTAAQSAKTRLLFDLFKIYKLNNIQKILKL